MQHINNFHVTSCEVKNINKLVYPVDINKDATYFVIMTEKNLPELSNKEFSRIKKI
jgi:hypothetical protein